MPALLERIARVRDELPHEDLLVGIERLCHDVQQLLRLSLELHCRRLANRLLRWWRRRRRRFGRLRVGAWRSAELPK